MWQFLLGTYIFISAISGAILWASLVLAKNSGHDSESRYQPMIDATSSLKDNLNDNPIFQLPTFSQHGKK
jgi:hypothetical protein